MVRFPHYPIATYNSLVLLDEVGNLQSFDKNLTSVNIYELVSRPHTMSCISTHFPNIPSLTLYYPQVVNRHFEAVISEGRAIALFL